MKNSLMISRLAVWICLSALSLMFYQNCGDVNLQSQSSISSSSSPPANNPSCVGEDCNGGSPLDLCQRIEAEGNSLNLQFQRDPTGLNAYDNRLFHISCNTDSNGTPNLGCNIPSILWGGSYVIFPMRNRMAISIPLEGDIVTSGDRTFRLDRVPILPTSDRMWGSPSFPVWLLGYSVPSNNLGYRRIVAKVSTCPGDFRLATQPSAPAADPHFSSQCQNLVRRSSDNRLGEGEISLIFVDTERPADSGGCYLQRNKRY